MSTLAVASRRGAQVVIALSGDITAPVTSGAFPVQDGSIIAGGSIPWVVIGGAKYRFSSALLFWWMGYTGPMELAASAGDLAAVPTGGIFG
jgi:hypothetical protein